MYQHVFKRILDLLFALLLLPFVLLLCLMLAPLIVLGDRGPVFYIAPRLGKDARVFSMYKLRSMKVNAADLRNPDGSTFNSQDDPRQTFLGRILRKTSLDELPQVFNILLGQMSLVGPRPDLPDALEKVYQPGDEQRLLVRPGITGLAQAFYRNDISLRDRTDLDIHYARNHSLKMDASILWQTLKTVLGKKGIYRNVS